MVASSEWSGGVEPQIDRGTAHGTSGRQSQSGERAPTRSTGWGFTIAMEENMNKLNLLVIATSAAAWLTGCATDPGNADPAMQASDQQALANAAAPSQDSNEPGGNDAHARQIAQAKLAELARQGISVDSGAAKPDSAACGRNGPTGSAVRTNNALAPGVDAAKIRTGSSTGCTAVGQINPGEDANYFCFTSAGNFTWTFLQDIQSGKRGWTRDDLLRNDGSFTFCGF